MSVDNFSMTPGGVVMENTDVSPIIDEATIMTSGSFIADVEETVRAFKLLAESINFTSEDMISLRGSGSSL